MGNTGLADLVGAAIGPGLDRAPTGISGLDQINAFGADSIVRAELSRLARWLEDRGVTAIVTGERGDGSITRHGIEEYVSDCVIVLDHRVREEISTRRLRVVKYRGSAHGTNEYPFFISARGFVVLPITSITLDYGAPRSGSRPESPVSTTCWAAVSSAVPPSW